MKSTLIGAFLVLSNQMSFTIKTDGSFVPTVQQVQTTRAHFQALSAQYPKLVAKVMKNGYKTIVFKKSPGGKFDTTALATLEKKDKTIVIYKDLLETANATELQRLPYSFARVALLHELLHGYDQNSQLVVHHLPLLGWDLKEGQGHRGFKIKALPWIENVWMKHKQAVSIASSTDPKIARKGRWPTHLEAAKKSRAFGYPTIYSVVGGPNESFAELGAYIALDPEAEEYVPHETLRWFREEVLL